MAGLAIADRIAPRFLLGAQQPAASRNVVVVTFGGGVRYSETSAPRGFATFHNLPLSARKGTSFIARRMTVCCPISIPRRAS